MRARQRGCLQKKHSAMQQLPVVLEKLRVRLQVFHMQANFTSIFFSSPCAIPKDLCNLPPLPNTPLPPPPPPSHRSTQVKSQLEAVDLRCERDRGRAQ